MTNAEARCNKSLRPRKPEGSLGRTAQDVHLDSHTAPELLLSCCLTSTEARWPIRDEEWGVWRWGKREIIDLSLHCHPQNDSCIKIGSGEGHFNISLNVRDSHKTVSTDHNF